MLGVEIDSWVHQATHSGIIKVGASRADGELQWAQLHSDMTPAPNTPTTAGDGGGHSRSQRTTLTSSLFLGPTEMPVVSGPLAPVRLAQAASMKPFAGPRGASLASPCRRAAWGVRLWSGHPRAGPDLRRGAAVGAMPVGARRAVLASPSGLFQVMIRTQHQRHPTPRLPSAPNPEAQPFTQEHRAGKTARGCVNRSWSLD